MTAPKKLDGREKTILDSINEGVFTVDLEWRIAAFNRATEKITKASQREALGQQCYDVFRASICENACACFRNA
jgi:PAS domain-containing protein